MSIYIMQASNNQILNVRADTMRQALNIGRASIMQQLTDMAGDMTADELFEKWRGIRLNIIRTLPNWASPLIGSPRVYDEAVNAAIKDIDDTRFRQVAAQVRQGATPSRAMFSYLETQKDKAMGRLLRLMTR